MRAIVGFLKGRQHGGDAIILGTSIWNDPNFRSGILLHEFVKLGHELGLIQFRSPIESYMPTWKNVQLNRRLRGKAWVAEKNRCSEQMPRPH